MAKKIKRNLDIAIVMGIGLSLLIVAMIGVYERVPPIKYASAATTADVAVSATVAESAELTITAEDSGVSINGTTTNVTTTATTTPFGALSTSENKVAAHTLTMTTNAGGGYTVDAKYNNKLRSTASTTKDIDDHSGTNASPSAFSAAGTEAFGYTTEDFSLSVTGDGADRFSGGDWAGFTASDEEVAYHTGPVNATTTKTGYQAGISGLTSAADDYGCTVTYSMTSTF